MRRPPFRADHVGSFLRPERLRQAREKFAAGEMAAQDLHAVEDACIREVVRAQEDVGLEGDHRRRVPPHLFPRRFPRAARGRRGALRRVCRELPKGRRHAGRLQAPDDACREQGQVGSADPGARLRLLEVGRDPHAEGLHPGAVDAALPRRPRGDQRGGLPQPRGVLRGPDRRVPGRGRRSGEAWLTLPAVRRHQPRLSLRPGNPRPHQGARRRPRRADAPLLPADRRVRSATGRPT